MKTTKGKVEMAKKYTVTKVSESKHSCYSVAPNRSSAGTDYYTVVVYRYDWHEGYYAGRSYKRVETWLSCNPNTKGQLVNSTDEPWTE